MIQRGEIGFDARGGAVHDGVGVEGSHATVGIDQVDDLVQVLVPAARSVTEQDTNGRAAAGSARTTAARCCSESHCP